MNTKKILLSGFNFTDDEYELKSRYLLFNAILHLVIIMLSILTALRMYQENYLQVVLNILFILISLYTIYYIRQDKANSAKIFLPLVSLFFILISISFVNTNMYIVGASWFIVLVVPSYFLGNFKTGIFFTILSVINIIFLSLISQKPYLAVEYFYVLTPLVLTSFLVYIYERTLKSAQNLLKEKNKLLKAEVQQKTLEEHKLIQENEELANVISKSNIELYIVDYDTDVYLYANKGGINALGYSLEELQTMSVYDTNPTLTVEIVQKLKSLKDTLPNIMNITQHQRKDGSIYGVQSLIHTITYQGKAAYAIYDINLTDVHAAQSQLLEQKELLLQQAYYDNLTTLPNRILFDDRLKQAISKSNRSKKGFAILFIDLDKFKEVNDTLGHRIGDFVLQEIAGRLQKTLREEDTISRFGGDEFVCIIEQASSKESLSELAQKLIHKVRAPIIINENKIVLTCSIGISIYPQDVDNADMLIHHADSAMYKAKDSGKDNFQFYSSIEDNSQIS